MNRVKPDYMSQQVYTNFIQMNSTDYSFANSTANYTMNTTTPSNSSAPFNQTQPAPIPQPMPAYDVTNSTTNSTSNSSVPTNSSSPSNVTHTNSGTETDIITRTFMNMMTYA